MSIAVKPTEGLTSASSTQAAEQLSFPEDWNEEARNRETMEDWAVCWPEWEGPKAGGFCSVHEICAELLESGEQAYHYAARVRLIELRPDGKWIGKIEYPEQKLRVCPWMNKDQGRLLLLPVWNIWPPVDDLNRRDYALI